MRSAIVVLLILASPVAALEPRDVFVVANRNVPGSRDVAEHYLAKRGVPKENLIELDLPAGEDISRADYDTKLAGPLREALKDRKDAVKVILTVYGVPLRVGAKQPTAQEKADAEKLRPELEAARKALGDLQKANTKVESADLQAAIRKVNELDAREVALMHRESTAAVDSELMLLWWPSYPVARWVGNPLYWRVPDANRKKSPPVVLTSRLDGPTPEIARRLVDDAVAVESKGLAGNVVIDARGIKFDVKNPQEMGGYGYGGYDESMREAAKLLGAAGFAVTLDDKPELLPAGSAKGVAIYCGWYSLGKFVDCCDFVPGAVAWHLASSEAVSLRDPKSPLWCPSLLKKGVAATLGPVSEPYTFGFPKPAEFFGFLATGEFTLVECYARTSTFCSWQMVLVGDPLYNPFKAAPKLKSADVPQSPKGGLTVIW
jgi:uncharacterized protein (TIGR03790 family)